MYKVAWLNKSPYCWAASTDGGRTYTKLEADNDEASYEAIDEAAKRFNVSTDKWDLEEEPITSLYQH